MTGTPLTLHYQSDRVPGRRATQVLRVRLSGTTLPPGLQRIHLEIAVAGQTFASDFAPQPDLVDTFTWDGKDVYGRPVPGQQPVKVRIGYEYIAQYYATQDTLLASYNRFGAPPNASASDGSGVITFSRIDARLTTPPIILWQEYQASLGSFGSLGLGGWSLGVHHVYDVWARILYLGNGAQRSAEAVGVIIDTAVGTGATAFSGDGGPATQASVSSASGVAIGPDGSLYIADSGNNRIRRVGADGVITTVAGNGLGGFAGDGGPATQARLSSPHDVAVASDGSLYINDRFNNRIRRVAPDGIITTFAGTGPFGYSGDGGPATQAKLNDLLGIAVAPDGSVYIGDRGNLRIRRVGPDGIITTVAGTGIGGFSGDGGLATQAQLNAPAGLAVGSDGSLYIADSFNRRVRRMGPDGIITTVAGSGIPGYGGDGGPATQALLNSPSAIAVGTDGRLYIADFGNSRIRQVGTDGIINTVAGNGTGGFTGDGGLATQARIGDPNPEGVAVGVDGTLYIPDRTNNRIRRLSPPLPGFSFGDIFVAAADGSEIYVFTGAGRHRQTLDALTGAVRYQFTYDSAGRLASVADGDGNVTNIARDGSGNPTAIVAPFGQQTTLAVNADGYLSNIANPAGQATQLAYLTGTAAGLLATLTDPGGGVHLFQYDALGRLTRDQNPAGGAKVLARTELGDKHYKVTVTTGSGLVTAHEVEELPTGDVRRLLTEASGAITETLLRADGSRRLTYPNGTVLDEVDGPDPRFGMQAPMLKSQVLTTPGGKTQVITRTQSVTLTNPSDLLSLSTLSSTITIDGRTTTTNYDATTRTLTLHTPANRTGTATLDVRGRMTGAQLNGLAPIAFAYTANGRVNSVTAGTGGAARTTALTYGAGPNAAYLAQMNDPLGRPTNFAYDSAGRATQQTLPGARTIGFSHDADGDLASLTPPGRAAHTFTWTADGQLASYAPPTIVGGGAPITYSYDIDGRLVQVIQADGQVVTVTYDATGRPIQFAQPGRTIAVAYQGVTANIQNITGPAGQQLTYGADGPLLISQIWSGPVAGTVSRTLDNGLRSATRTVNGNAITLAYDQDSELTAAGALTLVRNPSHGMVSATTLGNLTDSWTYTGFGGMDHYTASFSGMQLYDVQNTRDALERITAKTETIGGTTASYAYGYDIAGRLVQVQKDGATTHTYSYDANGNRVSANAVAATYDGQDRQTQLGATVYTYTPNGERQTKSAAGITTYAYDAIGNLLNVTLPDATQIAYLVDGLGRRIGKKVNGTLQQAWLYDERSRIVAELDGAGALVSRFVYASRPGVPDYMVRGGINYRLVSDALGTVRLVVNATDGSIAQRLDYDPFGSVTNDSAPGFQPFAFAGGLYDRHTLLVRFGARDYDAETGRWTTKDPIGFGGGDTNLYAYVANDPVNRHDSSGLDGPGDAGACYGPPPPPFDQRPSKPQFLDPSKLPAVGGSGSSGGGGGLSLGPFTFSGELNWPSIGDLRDWNPLSLFDKFGLKLVAPLNPDLTLPDRPKDPGSPDPNGPNPKPQGPECNREPSHDPGFTSCQ